MHPTQVLHPRCGPVAYKLPEPCAWEGEGIERCTRHGEQLLKMSQECKNAGAYAAPRLALQLPPPVVDRHRSRADSGSYKRARYRCAASGARACWVALLVQRYGFNDTEKHMGSRTKPNGNPTTANPATDQQGTRFCSR
jgi:hypothetical protein